MPEPCIDITDLERILALPAGDPARRHLETCPRCRALIASYSEFLDPVDLPADAKVGEAKRRLTDMLEAEILGEASRRPASLGPGLFRRLFPAGGVPVWRPALALAGVVLIIVTAKIFLPGDPWIDDDLRYRGEDPRGTAIRTEATALEDGGFSLNWSPVEGAQYYEVSIIGSDLFEKACYSAGADTLLLIAGPDLEAFHESGPLLWTVTAFLNSDVLAESNLSPLASGP